MNKSEFRIDDEMARQIEAYKQDLEPFVGKEALDAAIAAVPFVGSVILSITNDVATRKSFERAIEMFRLIKEILERLDENKLDKASFKTDEFQTLLFLAFEQLRTTHDKEKRAMLAAALSNSGTTEFSTEERKELFVRILRDLSPQHIRVLKELVPAEHFRDAGPTFWPTESNPGGEFLGLLQYLTAMGLVEESLHYDKNRSLGSPRYSSKWTEHDIERALKEYVNVPPTRQFKISQFGMDFLRFMSEPSIPPTGNE